LEVGIEIPDINKIEVGPDNSLRYLLDGKYHKIVINIYDAKNIRIDTDNIEELNKYHLFNCRTIDKMKQKGLKFRYIISTNKTPKFKYKGFDTRGVRVKRSDQELLFCQNCLHIYNRVFRRDANVDSFNKKNFSEYLTKATIYIPEESRYYLVPDEWI